MKKTRSKKSGDTVPSRQYCIV